MNSDLKKGDAQCANKRRTPKIFGGRSRNVCCKCFIT